VTVEGTSNSFGDVQLTVDLIADKILFDFAAKHPLVYQAASEEAPELKTMNAAGRFVLCWDPLDGSSIIDNNWSVGTIVGIWDRRTGLLGACGRDQLSSVVVQYGARCTALVALDDGTYEFTLQADGSWLCSRHRIRIQDSSKLFSPANLRAAQDLPGYAQLIDTWMRERKTLRYTGGLVPDVYQQFTKGQGVFANPTSTAAPAKLRLAFEAAPFALLVERAGGQSSDGSSGSSILTLESIPWISEQRFALARRTKWYGSTSSCLELPELTRSRLMMPEPVRNGQRCRVNVLGWEKIGSKRLKSPFPWED